MSVGSIRKTDRFCESSQSDFPCETRFDSLSDGEFVIFSSGVFGDRIGDVIRAVEASARLRNAERLSIPMREVLERSEVRGSEISLCRREN